MTHLMVAKGLQIGDVVDDRGILRVVRNITRRGSIGTMEVYFSNWGWVNYGFYEKVDIYNR